MDKIPDAIVVKCIIISFFFDILNICEQNCIFPVPKLQTLHNSCL